MALRDRSLDPLSIHITSSAIIFRVTMRSLSLNYRFIVSTLSKVSVSFLGLIPLGTVCLYKQACLDVASTTATAVAKTSTPYNHHHMILLGDELYFLEKTLRLIDPSSSSSRLLNFCFQVSILRFMVAGWILQKKEKKNKIVS
jgi:hypothetical protein